MDRTFYWLMGAVAALIAALWVVYPVGFVNVVIVLVCVTGPIALMSLIVIFYRNLTEEDQFRTRSHGKRRQK